MLAGSPPRRGLACTWCKSSCQILTGTLGAAGPYTFAVQAFQRHVCLFSSVPAQVGNQTQAAECAASYLLFYPTDEPMLEKMKQYRTELGEDAAVTARQVLTTSFLVVPCPTEQGHSPRDKKGKLFHSRHVPRPGLKKLEFTSGL